MTPPKDLAGFYNIHDGETCLIVGNGPSQSDLPLEFLHKYPSFASNTVFRREGFMPTYYATVDKRVWREFREEVDNKFSDIPKFFPTPDLDRWEGKNIYRWYHRPGALWPWNGKVIWPRDILSKKGLVYACVTHVLFQLAFFMGFTTMLLVGADHDKPAQHFWGEDTQAPGKPHLDAWARGYKELAEGFAPRVKVLNISTKTKLNVLERDDWSNW